VGRKIDPAAPRKKDFLLEIACFCEFGAVLFLKIRGQFALASLTPNPGGYRYRYLLIVPCPVI